MMKKLTDFFGDKRIAYIYVVVIVVLLSGVTYALSPPNSVALNLTTGRIGIDEEHYGDTSFDSTNITLTPILDTEVETRLENVIKIDFTVGGANTNNANNNSTKAMAVHLSSFFRPAKQPKSTNTATKLSNPDPTSNNIRLKSIIVIHLFYL